MSFKDLDEFYKIQPKRLPVRGRTYDFPGSVSGKTGLLLHRMTQQAEAAKERLQAGEVVDLDAAFLDDAAAGNLQTEILGDAHEQMIDDGVPAEFIDHVFKTLIAWHQFGEGVARAVWEDVPGAPKAKRPTDRQRPKGTSGKARTTRKPASTTRTSASTKESPGDASSPAGA